MNHRAAEDLGKALARLDGHGYKAYRDIEGAYTFPGFRLIIDHVQGDPFAAPSRMRVRVPLGEAGFPEEALAGSSRRIALRDFLTREFALAADRIATGRRGSGGSGVIAIDRPGQEILERTSLLINGPDFEARFVMGLPARGRRIDGKAAAAMLRDELPEIVGESLYFHSPQRHRLIRHLEVNEDADALRGKLAELGCIGFVADGSVLPRLSGVDDRPMKGKGVIPFSSPPSSRITTTLPNCGEVTGMGIRSGVTLIAGGGYHGKSTLLSALEYGIYNHVPGDGREYVVTLPRTVKVRAEDGRRIERVDISPFIGTLPFGRGTRDFSTDDASGSTSQAAGIMEALEVGADALLIDEDTSATNFMIRDHRMQELIARDREPITPFIDKVRQLYTDLGVSSVIVMGGSGDYFDATDAVICMEEYRPQDCTAKARAIAEKYAAERKPEGGECFGEFRQRIPVGESFDPGKGKRKVKVAARGRRTILFGRHAIDLSAAEQLVDSSQTRAIGNAIVYATRYMDGRRTLEEVIGQVFADMGRGGLDVLVPGPWGDLAAFRAHELAAAINRLRTVTMRQRDGA
ncbi:MAG: ABC-ATPase domain-containing protein [Methanomicrobiaceae archaeon]|nr:ABC-ATPase domain-containing protein [Methanomicrobiaceae archaeon]